MGYQIDAVRSEEFSIGVYGAEKCEINEKTTACVQIFSGCADMHLRLSNDEVKRLVHILMDASLSFDGVENGTL